MIFTVTLNPAVDKIAKVDEVVIGKVNRLSQIESEPGGKGINVARTIKTLDIPCIATGFLGGSGGNLISCMLQREEVECHMVHIIGNTRTNLKIIDGANQMSEFNEEGPFILQNECDELMDYFNHNLDVDSILVISGSIPKGLSSSTYAGLIEMAKDLGAKVLIDTNIDLLKGAMVAMPDIVKLDAADLCRLVDHPDFGNTADYISYATMLLAQNVGVVIIRVDFNHFLIVSHELTLECEIQDADVRMGVGAGDAFVAGFVVGLNQRLALRECIHLAGSCFRGACFQKSPYAMFYERIVNSKDYVVIKEVECI